MLVLNQSSLALKDVPEEIQEQENPMLQNALAHRLTLEEMNRMYINLVYEHLEQNKKAACDFLQINYRTLVSRLKSN